MLIQKQSAFVFEIPAKTIGFRLCNIGKRKTAVKAKSPLRFFECSDCENQALKYRVLEKISFFIAAAF